MAKLGDICIVQAGGTPSRSVAEYWQEGNIPWVKISDFNGKHLKSTEEYITSLGLEKSSAKLFEKGTILYTIFATLGEVSVLDIDAATNQAIAGLKLIDTNISLDYLYYFLVSKKEEVNRIGRGVAQNNINLGILKNFEIPLISTEEQKNIVVTLNKLNDCIELRKQQLSKLDELVKSRFIEMFGNETEFGKWECCQVGDVADICVGVVIKPTQYYTDNSGIPTFRSLNIGEMQVKDNDWVYFTEEGHHKNKKSIIRENDVLVVRSGAPGTACVATKKYAGYNAVDIIIAHPNQDKINSIFLAAFTNMPHGMGQIREKTGGAAQQHFNVGGYKKIHLILPPIKLQDEFAAFVEQTDKLKLEVKESLEKLETLKKSLMQKYFG